jgi:hypothetical protein
MGYASDLGKSTVEKVDPRTGLPMDKWGHLLNPKDIGTGKLVKGWNKKGTELYNLTSPYGFLEYALGSGDDFLCLDFTVIYQPGRKWLVLHAVLNSETGHFIQGSGYEVLQLTGGSKGKIGLEEVANTVMFMMDDAFDDVRHNKSGWNQDPWYFYRRVVLTAAREIGVKIPEFSDRQYRFGGKEIDGYIKKIVGF